MTETPRPPKTLTPARLEEWDKHRVEQLRAACSKFYDRSPMAVCRDAVDETGREHCIICRAADALQEARASLKKAEETAAREIREAWADRDEARAERDASRKAFEDATGCTRQDCPCAFGDRHMWHQAYREKKAELEAFLAKKAEPMTRTPRPPDPIVQAAKAGWSMAVRRLQQAISATKEQHLLPLTAEECVTILEHSDIPTELPEEPSR